jgi:uncharacterized protein YdbL (DUF1318 family)
MRRLIGLSLLLALAGATAASAQTVTVNFSVDQGAVTYRASGFLHGMNATTPTTALIAPLKPKFFRDADNS